MTNLQLVFVFIKLTPIDVYILCIYSYKQGLYFSYYKMFMQNFNKNGLIKQNAETMVTVTVFYL